MSSQVSFGLVEYLGVLTSIGGAAFVRANWKKFFPVKKVKVSRETSNANLTNQEMTNEDMEDLENRKTLLDLEDVIAQFDLNLKTVDIIVTVNTVKYVFETYVKNDEIISKDGSINTKKSYTKIKEILSLNLEFEAVTSNKLVIKSENKQVIFETPRKKKYRPKINYNQFMQHHNITSDHLRKHYELPVVLGVNEYKELQIIDLQKMPHLLMAGATGSGKSVFLNTLLCGLIKNLRSDEIKFAMVDPKRVELDVYNDLDSDYLFDKIAKEPEDCESLILKVYEEMQQRYKIMEKHGVRNINALRSKGVQMPYLVLAIDEFANVMELKGRNERKDFESMIAKLGQMARAAGIHMIIATQRPTVDVITGTIKANLTSRIAFSVVSGKDSQSILDKNGAEKLNGEGDGLFMFKDELMRFQSFFMSDTEIETIIKETV